MNAKLKNASATSLSLLDAVRTNDQLAWERMVATYGRLVYYWCRRTGLAHAEVPDVVQSVFQSVFTSLEGFHRSTEQGSFRGWLRTITRNKVYDLRRRRKGEAVAKGGTSALAIIQSTPDEISNADTEATEHELIVQSTLAVIQNDFEVDTWKAFEMTMTQEMTSTEAAAALGLTPNAVRHAKARVLRRLREELEGVLEF